MLIRATSHSVAVALSYSFHLKGLWNFGFFPANPEHPSSGNERSPLRRSDLQSAGKAPGMAQKLLARFGFLDGPCCFFVGALVTTMFLLCMHMALSICSCICTCALVLVLSSFCVLFVVSILSFL